MTAIEAPQPQSIATSSAAEPLIRIEGVAHVRVHKEAHEGWVGTPELSLTSDFIPGCAWLGYCALPLQMGRRYRAEVFAAPELDAVASKALPKDVIVKGESVEFYAHARTSKARWPADHRVKRVGMLGVWTDGVMVDGAPGTSGLQLGKAYRVVVRALGESE